MNASARLAPRASAPPAPSGWRYVDEARTHGLSLEWRAGDPSVLVLREWAPGEPDASARLEELLPLREPWAARLRHWELEAQLSLMGRYWRQQAGHAGWSLVGRPAGAPTVDLRPSESMAREDASLVHHFHQRGGERDRILAALRIPSDPRQAYQVVSAELDFAAVEARGVCVLHPRLPPGLARSRLARGAMDLSARGYRALVTREDYVSAFGAGGPRQAAALWEDVLGRLRAGHLGAAGDDEGDDATSLAEILHVLNDPRLLALHRRFLAPEEEAVLVTSNGPAIRRAVAQRRAQASHQDQHLLTVLEASLLARERIRHKRFRCTDPEVAALRRLAFYL